MVCRRGKGPVEKTKVPLKLFREGMLHGRWHVDLTGELPTTKDGFKYVLVAVDAFSGWPVTVPLFKQIMELYHIKKFRTTAFHPAANGKVEKWIRTQIQYMAILHMKSCSVHP